MNHSIENIVFESNSAVDFLERALSFDPFGGSSARLRKPRGSINNFSKFLNCHPTFVNQVLRGKSTFSIDQALRVADFFEMNEMTVEHWLDLVQLDRVVRADAANFFKIRIARRKRERDQDLSKFLNGEKSTLNKNIEIFFSDWALQLIYSLLHLPGSWTLKNLHNRIGLSESEAGKHLANLQKMGLIKAQNDIWIPSENFLHLSKDSDYIKLLHQTWRIKSLIELERLPKDSDFRYSGVITVSKKQSHAIKKKLKELLSEIKNQLNSDESTECFGVVLDYFEM